MSGDHERCTSCQEQPPSVTLDGLCRPCADEQYPPIERRGGRWSPLAIGTLSLVCDPLLIPTVLALKRAFAELRMVRVREDIGLYREEHARVRSGALWGMVFGSGRIALFVVVLLSGALTAPIRGLTGPSRPASVRAYDELGEVLERLESDDEAAVALALEHLPEVIRETDDVDASERALRAATAIGAAPLRDRALRSALSGIPTRGVQDAALIAAHDRASAEVQDVILARLAAKERLEALTLALRSHADDAPPLAPIGERADLGSVLMQLPRGHAYRAYGIDRLIVGCLDRPPRPQPTQQDMLESVERALLDAREADLTPLERSHRVRRAAQRVEALGCVESASARERLSELLQHEEPRVVAAAIATLRFGADPRAHADRLTDALRDPLARADWFARLLPLPRAFRGPEAVAEAAGAALLEEQGHHCDRAAVEERQRRGSVTRIVHRFRCDDGTERFTRSAALPRELERWHERCASRTVVLDRELLQDPLAPLVACNDRGPLENDIRHLWVEP